MRKFWNQRGGLLLASGLMMALASDAHADVIATLFGTGVNELGTTTGVAVGSMDQHYTLIAAPDGENTGPFVQDNSLPNDYAPNTATSQYIGPSRIAATTHASGNYDYQTTFLLAAFDLSTVSITGMAAADDSVIILLNGQDINQGLQAPAYTNLQTFMINSGFVQGLNTLDFVVNNLNGPTGLQVQISGSAAVPEPSSLALCGLAGLIGSACAWRRKTRKGVATV